ncbi:MAG: hypothetical protein N2249_00445 [Melioribacter sp.]|nr:hypothetical protein [Melioribacter sp.]
MNLQKLSEFTLQIFQSIFSIIKIVFLSKYFTKLRNKNLVNKDCVILANGPCLKKDLDNNYDFIINHVKFCVNFFALSEEYEKLKPNYYVIAAPEFWLKKTTDFFKEQKNKLINCLISKTNWELNLLIPFQAKNSSFLNELKKNSNIKVIHYNNTPIEGLQFIINYLFNLNLGMPRPHNVLIPAIFLALNIGFKKIYIFGADHSWHEEIKVDELNKATVNHEHFYDKSEIRMPMYKLDGKEYHIHDIFRKLHYAFKGYFILRSYADFLNAKIYNASSKSYIDAFERIKLS